MNIPDCYEAYRQAECLEAAADMQESRLEKCGCCGRPIHPGEPFWKGSRLKEQFSICQSCKEDIEDSVSIAEEDSPW